jgi:hypothetical protein
MATAPVVGTGPVEFLSEQGPDQGKQMLIPLTFLYFDANGVLKGDKWPLYLAHQATVDALLDYLSKAGAVYPAPQPSPPAALTITARHAGSSGNNIQLTFSNSGTSDPNDPKKFDAALVESDTYIGLTKDTAEQTVGTNAGAGLVFVTQGSAKARPKAGQYPMATLAQPFKVEVLDDHGNPAFELQPRDGTDNEAKNTTITVSGISNDPNDPHFNLTVTWQKTVAGLNTGQLQTDFEYEITVDNPPGGNQLGMPANGTIALRGGSDPAVAKSATAVVAGAG